MVALHYLGSPSDPASTSSRKLQEGLRHPHFTVYFLSRANVMAYLHYLTGLQVF